MADLEDVTLDGRPLQSLRVADLKAALEERGLSKSGQKNALIKRLKGALMLENLQRTSTAHIGLQPNSQIGEEMSQNSFIKQYLAKQQELLRQRLEREAREAYETNEQEDHSAVNNSTSCPPQAQDAPGVLAEQHKPAGPSGGEKLFGAENEGDDNREQEADMSRPPASGSVAMHGPGSEQRPDRGPASCKVAADSDDDDDSEDGEEDGDDDDWGSGARRTLREPARLPATRDRSGASCQPQQQHIPSLLSPQLRQPTPPPSPPPELSFPLPDTPKQSPPSPDVPPSRRSPSTSSSGSSSSDSRSSSPEPSRSGHVERKPGPLTLLARKMESEGAFSGAGWHGGDVEGDRQGTSSPSATLYPGRGPLEGLVSAITHTANTVCHVPMIPVNTQGVAGAHSAHIQVPVSVLKASAKEERDSELEREKALELERRERQKKIEQEQALQLEQERALALEREEKHRALEKERMEQQLIFEREEREKAMLRERELALERERQERELALAKEREEKEQALARERALEHERQKELERQKALELERQKELERQRALEMERQRELERQMALEQERLQREKEEREEMERALEQERAKALEKERALEQERLERERALEAEQKERERIEREKQERERLERERVLEQERLEREKVLEQERIDREKAVEQERIERERAQEQERLQRERALEQERLEREKEEKERVLREKAEQERMEREKALQRETEEKKKAEREAAFEQERMEKKRAEMERKEKALEQEKLKREEEMAKERKDKAGDLEEKSERALERDEVQKEKALEREKGEQEKERGWVTEKGRESHLPPAKRGREIGFTPLPTPPLPSTGATRESSTEAEEQDDGPLFRNEAQAAESTAPMSPTPLSPQSTFKKFRFLRDSPIQSHSSSSSMVIKRPLTFSDAPQQQAALRSSPISIGERQQEKPQSSTEKEEKQMCRKQVSSGPPENEENKAAVGTTLDHIAKKESTKNTKVDEVEEGGDAKKEVKQRRQRSPSNDSSSSESDSGSSSSQSSRSSTTSQENSNSNGRKEEKPRRDLSPQHSVTIEPHIKGLQKTLKASPHRREMSGEKNNTTSNRDSPTKKPSMDLPTREETQRKRKHSEDEEEKDKDRQVKETAMAQPEKPAEISEETPKVFSARKISLSSSKSSPGASTETEQDSGTVGGRKRRWGSSTAVTAKKPSISITTDSLKSLIPDIRPPLGQDAVVDLHPEEAVLSGTEDEERERSDHDLQIRRTVTQVVHPESQENGQKEAKRSRHEELEDEGDVQGDTERTKVLDEKMDSSFPGTVETQSPSHSSHDVEINTVTPSDTLIRRSISQQKTGVSITIDDPVRTARQPSPPRGKVSNIVHICNLVRPFTLGQLKELLSRTGTLVEEGFWIDKIKSHCYVTYSSSEEAVATREALHGVKWPQSNPKVLSVEFSQQDELDFHKGLGTADKPRADEQGPGPGRGRTSGLPSLLPERDQWAEREREMERRERARAEREWDRDKVKEFGKPGEEKDGGPRRSRSRERRRKERGKSKEKKTEKKEKTVEDPPAKLLDDLFCKTKAAPCIYWLPLTEEQFIQREAARAERIKEREKRRKEQEEEEEKKKEEERKEKIKAGGSTSTTGDRGDGEKDKDRERDRDRGRDRDRERERENEKRRDGYRRPGGSGAGGSRRSRSRSDPRERRR